MEQIRTAIIARDRQDFERRINPLRQAEDAIVIDSTRLTLHQVADRILKVIRNRMNGSASRRRLKASG